jgi:hypothetical protein
VDQVVVGSTPISHPYTCNKEVLSENKIDPHLQCQGY